MKNVKLLSFFIMLLVLFGGKLTAAVNLLTPSNSANCVTPDALFKWNSVENAVQYTFYFSTSPNFAVDSTVTYNLNFQTDTTLTPNTFLGSSMASNTYYYWKVRAKLTNDQLLYSQVYTFHTLVNPLTLISPVDGDCCLDLLSTFRVQTEYSKVDSIRFVIAKSQNMQNVVIDTMFANPKIELDLITIALKLPLNSQTYYWVAYQNSGNCWSTMLVENAHSFCTRAAKPALLSPANSSLGIPLFQNGLPFTATFKWKPVTGALKYIGQYSTTSDFQSYTKFETTDTFAIVTMPNDYNSKYYWRVFAKTEPITLIDEVLDTCSSEISDVYSFKTPIQPITLALPADLATCVPMIVNVSWDTLALANYYQIQVSLSSDFNPDSIVIDRDKIDMKTTTLNLPIGIRNYYWRVRVKNDDNIGLWSVPFKFTSTAETPKEIYPKSGATGITKTTTLKWELGKANSSYHLLISKKPEFDTTLVDTLITVNEFTYNFPAFNSKYYWKVMGIYNVCQGAWSDIFNFKTYIDAPVLTNPKNDTTGYEPVLVTFKWQGAQGTELYDYDISKDSNFTDLLTFERNKPADYAVIDNLLENTKYWWRVRGKNTEGTSEWSKVFKLKTGYIRPNAPVLLSPINGAYRLPIDEITLTWESAARASKYLLEVSTEQNFSTYLVQLDTLVNTTFTIKNLENNKVYYWRVAGINVQGKSSYSNVWSFRTIPVAPTDTVILTEPADKSKNLLTTKQTFKWQTITNIDSYELWIAKDKDFNDIIIKNDKVWINQFVNQAVKLDGLTTYYWKVRGMNDAGTSPWSEVWSFTTEDPSSVRFTDNFATEILPSPILNQARVKISLQETSDVTFEVLDINGNVVLTRNFTQMSEGNNEFELDAKQLASGTYIYRISACGKVDFGKFVVNK